MSYFELVSSDAESSMLHRIRKFFDSQIEPNHSSHQPEQEAHSLRLATAALLIEISRADTDIATEEREAIVGAVQRVFDLDDNQTHELVEMAQEEVEGSVSLYQFTNLVDTRFTPEEKVQIVELLWRVSFADGELDKYEEHLIRKIAELLHVSHADYIQARHRVTGE